jgi:hypothetical protein
MGNAMSDKESVRAASRGNFVVAGDQPNWQEIRDGALLRIADAAEKMAQRHTDLIRERDSYERAYKREADESRRLARRITALQGVITRMRRKAQAVKQAQAAAR